MLHQLKHVRRRNSLPVFSQKAGLDEGPSGNLILNFKSLIHVKIAFIPVNAFGFDEKFLKGIERLLKSNSFGRDDRINAVRFDGANESAADGQIDAAKVEECKINSIIHVEQRI